MAFYFFLYALTIAVTRIVLKLRPKHGPKFFGWRPHHYVYGLVIAAFAWLFSWPALLAVGAALFVDEIPLFFIYKGFHWPEDHWENYQSLRSLFTVIAISLLGFAFFLYR